VDLVASIDATGLTFEQAKLAFLTRYPDFVLVADDDMRVDHVLTGRNPITTAYRYWVRRNDADSE
jgi:hypothetical protein